MYGIVAAALLLPRAMSRVSCIKSLSGTCVFDSQEIAFAECVKASPMWLLWRRCNLRLTDLLHRVVALQPPILL